ncbi:MAG TPA: S9 family peptidase [Phycisphaerae bacterium]|nr:S9 family peptidase [Phycisphaerae bacterium]
MTPMLYLRRGRRPRRLLLLVFAAFSTPPGAAWASDILTPWDVARLRSAATAHISPDGRHVAYTLQVPRDPWAERPDGSAYEDGPPWTELHVLDLDSARSRPFITGEVKIDHVAWTPDGRSISFLAERAGDQQPCLYAIPVDGGEARRILSHPTEISSYSWSPDGKQVAFLAEEETPQTKKDLKDKGFSAEVFEEELLFKRVWIATPDAEKDEPRKLELDGSVTTVHWSPVDGRLAVVIAPTSLIDDQYMKSKVWIVDSADGKVLAKLDNPGKLGSVAWNPTGTHLAMMSAVDMYDPAEGCLMVAPADGGALLNLTPDYTGHVTAVAWQDADYVMFLADEGTQTTFGKVKKDLSERKLILPVGENILTDFTLSKDGLHATFIGNSAKHPPEVFTMKHGEESPHRLTDSNPWLAGYRLAPQEIVKYSSRDGLEIQGVLVRPLDEKAGQRYPLILYVHGGPEAHERNGWMTNYSRPGQVAAARGFAVFYPNYRGSTGMGTGFAKLGQADEAGGEFNDLLDGVDHLTNLGLVDEKRVGVTGGSYGGYAAAWCATAHSERFAASVMFVGISDSISKKGTTDIPNEDFMVHVRQRPWDDLWHYFLERSPVYYVQKARTPILILHGKNDTRVHPSQSLLLYRYLKAVGQTPVRLVWYPGEGHGNRKYGARLDYHLRMMQWMEHYLKGPGGAPPAYEMDYDPPGWMKPAATTLPAKD